VPSNTEALSELCLYVNELAKFNFSLEEKFNLKVPPKHYKITNRVYLQTGRVTHFNIHDRLKKEKDNTPSTDGECPHIHIVSLKPFRKCS
jgi:hypothetical protein